MSGKVNIRELENFKERIEKSLGTDQIDTFLESCAKELTARLLARVIRRTPVGKKPKFEGEKKYEKIKVASSTTVTRKAGNGQVTYQRKVMRTRSFLTAEGARYEKTMSHWNGYIGGTLRRGWTNGQDQSASDYAQSLKVHRFGNTYVVEVVNPVKYASYVEFGHRQKPGRYVPALGKRLKSGWVEGKFMLTISENEIRASAPKVLENKLKKKLGEVFR